MAADLDDPFSSTRSRLPDDTVFYALYPDFSVSPSTAATTSAADLLSLHLQLIQSIAPFTASYIWQHQPFTLAPSNPSHPCPCSSPGDRHVPHLHGKLRFGDNLDDEWFVVFLLFHLTRSFPHLSARVWDSDGDFLLIEAAFHLPRWLNPDTSTNRIFIRNNDLHIIPRRRFPSPPPLSDALACLISHPEETRAPNSVQSAIKNRISEYPDRARKNMHQVRVRVPVEAAQVLKHEPCLIALAVEGFYVRDIDTMKFAAQMSKFCPKGKEEELVTVPVRMSRAMYAQLVQQTFQAPNCYPMPSRVNPQEYKEAEMGMKIACGLEMMYQHRKKVGEEGKGSTWEAFKESLEKSGYFRDLMPGSKQYKMLMASAEEYYRKSSLHQRSSEMLSAPVRRIDEILGLPHYLEDFKGQEVPPSDDDAWLYDGEEELTAAMIERQKEMELYEEERKKKEKGKEKAGADNPSGASQGDFDLGDIAKTMQAFVHKVSSHQGAEVPEDRNLENVDFDVDRFMKEMESAVGASIGEDDASDVDIEEGSSEMELDDDSEDESDGEEPPEADIRGREKFMDAYSDVLNEELKGSTLKKSFVRARDESSKKDEEMANATEEMDTDFTPVDVDVNLVKSLLDSFSSQEGMPGPASNLLGLMGLKLPEDDSDPHVRNRDNSNMRVSQKDVLPEHAGPSNDQRQGSVIDFSDVFGGPPRHASFQVTQNRHDDEDSWHGDEDSETAMGRSHNPNGKPVFGDESVNWRRYQNEDFFGDIFRGDQSPRIGGRDPLSPCPGSGVLSPAWPLPPGVEPLESPIQFSLPARVVTSHSSNSSLSRLSGRAFHNHDEYRGGDVFSSYRQGPLYSKASSNGEDLKRDVKVHGNNAGTQDHFHFSMHKWASKGVPLVMYVTKRNGLKPKEKSKLGNDAPVGEIQPDDVSTDGLLSFNLHVVSTAGEAKEPDQPVDKSVAAAPKLTRSSSVETKVLKPGPYVNEPAELPRYEKKNGDVAAVADVGGRKQKVVRSKLVRSLDADTGTVASREYVEKSKSKESLGFRGNSLTHQKSMGKNTDREKVDENTGNERSRERVKEDGGMNGATGKVGEFVKIFNQDPSSRPSAGFDGQRSSSGRWRDAHVSRTESKSTSSSTEVQEKMQGSDAKLSSSLKVGGIQFDTARTQETCKNSSTENGNVGGTTGEAIGKKNDVSNNSMVVEDLPDIVDKSPESADDQEDLLACESKILKWSKGKEGNIRALLSTLQYVLWQNSGWRPVPLVDIIEASAVKRSYQRALLCLHPDKLQQKGAAPLHKFIADKVFDILQEAWDQFNSLGSL